MKIEIEKWSDPGIQTISYEGKSWNVAYLHQMSKDLEVMDIPLDHIRMDYGFDKGDTMRGLLQHMKAVLDANMGHPIILDEDGFVLDGRHRLARAIFEKMETIKAVRFVKTPKPTSTYKIDEDNQ